MDVCFYNCERLLWSCLNVAEGSESGEFGILRSRAEAVVHIVDDLLVHTGQLLPSHSTGVLTFGF
jgi:hypothetical protein